MKEQYPIFLRGITSNLQLRAASAIGLDQFYTMIRCERLGPVYRTAIADNKRNLQKVRLQCRQQSSQTGLGIFRRDNDANRRFHG